mmetsp:Transcript_68462/g.155094  ORF Transcript_68462/g.155094 Transcript_68462/m.155094 type:complete len:121 (+) Transcript_68462:85-447(+)
MAEEEGEEAVFSQAENEQVNEVLHEIVNVWKGYEEEVTVDSLYGPRVLELDGSSHSFMTATKFHPSTMPQSGTTSGRLARSPFVKKWTEMGVSEKKVLVAIVAKRNLQMRGRIAACAQRA